jgi:hypothetical protein
MSNKTFKYTNIVGMLNSSVERGDGDFNTYIYFEDERYPVSSATFLFKDGFILGADIEYGDPSKDKPLTVDELLYELLLMKRYMSEESVVTINGNCIIYYDDDLTDCIDLNMGELYE